MTIGNPKPTQVLIDGIKLKDIIDSKFLGNCDKELPNYAIACVIITIPMESKLADVITLSHIGPEGAKDGVVLVDSQSPEFLEKALTILKRFEEEENGD